MLQWPLLNRLLLGIILGMVLGMMLSMLLKVQYSVLFQNKKKQLMELSILGTLASCSSSCCKAMCHMQLSRPSFGQLCATLFHRCAWHYITLVTCWDHMSFEIRLTSTLNAVCCTELA